MAYMLSVTTQADSELFPLNLEVTLIQDIAIIVLVHRSRTLPLTTPFH